MKRSIYQELKEWKQSPYRKPLILKGARQVGKTYSLEYFAQHEYKNYIHVNFDLEPQFSSIFEENLNPQRIIKELGMRFKIPINPATTLIIFDEIQECAKALNSLKYFCEQAPEYHIAAAGSLLGIKLNEGFPVGKVNFLHLKPLSFFEFLEAMGESALSEFLTTLEKPKAISTIFHQQLLKLLKYYFIIGGMPEVVNIYLKTEDLEKARATQKDILAAYTLDFAKHAPKEEVLKIMTIWELIPQQLAKENKKFIFSAISRSARANAYEISIQWLLDAGLIIKSYNITTPKFPLSAYANRRAFKLFMLDIGLLGAISDLDPFIMLQGNALFEEFKGALVENFVAQELHYKAFDDLYYWTSAGSAEVDFLVSTKQRIFPLEVKAGVSKQKKSLLIYGQKYLGDATRSDWRCPVLSRSTLRNFAFEKDIVNYPLYAVALFPTLVSSGGKQLAITPRQKQL